MTTEKLLDELRKQREALIAAINLIEHMLESERNSHKKRSLVRAIRNFRKQGSGGHAANKGFKYTKKNPHWMQKPENRARVQEMARKRALLNKRKAS